MTNSIDTTEIRKKKNWSLSVIPTYDIFPKKVSYFKELTALNVNMNIH